MTEGSVISAEVLRRVLGIYPTGVAVGSFASVSLDPPLVAFLPDKKVQQLPPYSDVQLMVFSRGSLGVFSNPLDRLP